jgi:PAS domain S-box-containing protein
MEQTAAHNEMMIPDEILHKWQGIVNILAEVLQVPVALINKLERPFIKVQRASESSGNYFREGQRQKLRDNESFLGTYCERVISQKAALLVPNAATDDNWHQGLGSRFGYVAYLGLPLLLPDGDVYGTICVVDTRENAFSKTYEALLGHFKDLVESHLALLYHAQKSLMESEERFRRLVESSLTGISILKDGQVVYQNPEQARLLGECPAGLLRPYTEFLHPEDAGKVERLNRDLLAGLTPTMDTDFRICPQGSQNVRGPLRWVKCRAGVVHIGGSSALLTNMMDITRTKELEYLLRMEDKMSALGRVAAGIAHEIRNPLSAINMFLNALKAALSGMEAEAPAGRSAAGHIADQLQTAADKIGSIIKRVMDFAKPNEPSMVRTNLNRAIEKAVELCAATVRKAGVRMEQLLAPDLPECRADAGMIEEVLLNLIANANQALAQSEGPKQIHITSGVQNDAIVIAVADSGPGVPEMFRESIFDPFFTTGTDGTGIGLSLARRIVLDHGGCLDVAVSRWGGAQFTIKIPLTPPQRSIPAPIEPPGKRIDG